MKKNFSIEKINYGKIPLNSKNILLEYWYGPKYWIIQEILEVFKVDLN